MPAGLHDRIMQSTSGMAEAKAAKVSWTTRVSEWIDGIKFPIPISIPQLAPVAMMFLFAFLVFSQTVSADGSLTDVYQKSYMLAEQTYEQSANAWKGKTQDQNQKQDGVTGTTYIDNEGKN